MNHVGRTELSRAASLGAESKRDSQHFRMKALKLRALALHGLARQAEDGSYCILGNDGLVWSDALTEPASINVWLEQE